MDVVQDTTSLTPPGVLFLIVMAVLTFSLSRRWAVLPLLATVSYMPLGQQLIVAGLHFQILRLVILIGLVRVVARGRTPQYSAKQTRQAFSLVGGIEPNFGGSLKTQRGTSGQPAWRLF